MITYTLPHFGKLPIISLKENYEVDIDLKGNEIHLDLNFDLEYVTTSTLEKVKNFLENLEQFDDLNKIHILNDFNNGNDGSVKMYLEHHLAEVDKAELDTIIDFDNTETEPIQQLLAKLKLVRVGIYPKNKENFAIFDYSIGKDITNYLIVINADENGKLDYLTMES